MPSNTKKTTTTATADARRKHAEAQAKADSKHEEVADLRRRGGLGDPEVTGSGLLLAEADARLLDERVAAAALRLRAAQEEETAQADAALTEDLLSSVLPEETVESAIEQTAERMAADLVALDRLCADSNAALTDGMTRVKRAAHEGPALRAVVRQGPTKRRLNGTYLVLDGKAYEPHDTFERLAELLTEAADAAGFRVDVKVLARK